MRLGMMRPPLTSTDAIDVVGIYAELVGEIDTALKRTPIADLVDLDGSKPGIVVPLAVKQRTVAKLIRVVTRRRVVAKVIETTVACITVVVGDPLPLWTRTDESGHDEGVNKVRFLSAVVGEKDG